MQHLCSVTAVSKNQSLPCTLLGDSNTSMFSKFLLQVPGKKRVGSIPHQHLRGFLARGTLVLPVHSTFSVLLPHALPATAHGMISLERVGEDEVPIWSD